MTSTGHGSQNLAAPACRAWAQRTCTHHLGVLQTREQPRVCELCSWVAVEISVGFKVTDQSQGELELLHLVVCCQALLALPVLFLLCCWHDVCEPARQSTPSTRSTRRLQAVCRPESSPQQTATHQQDLKVQFHPPPYSSEPLEVSETSQSKKTEKQKK